jgi:hypothetical protein
MRTAKSKETSTHTERCAGCGLFYEWLHPSPDGRTFLCRMCLELEGGNRSSVIVTYRRR